MEKLFFIEKIKNTSFKVLSIGSDYFFHLPGHFLIQSLKMSPLCPPNEAFFGTAGRVIAPISVFDRYSHVRPSVVML